MQNVLRISKKIDYALRAMIYLASVDGTQRVTFKEIAPRMRVPRNFLAKIMRTLARRGLVKSTRGAHGGYRLGRAPRDIRFLDVIEAVEGPVFINDCLDGSETCGLRPRCTLYSVFKAGQERMLDVYRAVTLESLTMASLPAEPRHGRARRSNGRAPA